LQLHEDWIHKAQASAPFQLRNAWLEDRNTNVLLSHRDVIYVDTASTGFAKSFKLARDRMDAPITEEMTVGPRPFEMRNVTHKRAGGKLLLVHGYCATVNEFPTSQFADSVQFNDLKASRSNDAFALKIKAFGDQFPSFGIVGHSQAGLASLHLHSFYWSNLEVNAGGKCRLLQSVGSPYYGSGLAGDLASIGPIFGLGCGKNTDLTYDGASLWERSIPPDVRKDVYYYTSQYTDGFFGGYCVWGAGIVLYSPNDGTTEVVKAKLAGANDGGHKSGWCHTTGMNYPAQCGDPTRNQEMNVAACR
jgi:hypothetical protein